MGSKKPPTPDYQHNRAHSTAALELVLSPGNRDCLLPWLSPAPAAASARICASGAGDGAAELAGEVPLLSCRSGRSCAGFAGRAGFVNFTLALNMLLVAADNPPVCHVLCVNTEAMLSMSCWQQHDTTIGTRSDLHSGVTVVLQKTMCCHHNSCY